MNEDDTLVNWEDYQNAAFGGAEINFSIIDDTTGNKVEECQVYYDYVSHSIVILKDESKWVFDADIVVNPETYRQSRNPGWGGGYVLPRAPSPPPVKAPKSSNPPPKKSPKEKRPIRKIIMVD